MSRDFTPEELRRASDAMAASGNMSYEEFCAEIDNQDLSKRLAEFKAAQRTRRYPCPRCGKMQMNDDPIRNALSRYADVMVCDSCGTDEAMRDYFGTPISLKEWSFATNPELFSE